MPCRRIAASALVALALSFLAPAPVEADVVYRAGAGRVVGKIVEETEEYLVIETRVGRVRLLWEEIDRVERGPVEEEAAPPAAPPRAPKESPAAPAPAPQPKPPVARPPAAKPAATPAAPPAAGDDAGAATEPTPPRPQALDQTTEALVAGLKARDPARREEAMAALATTPEGREALERALGKELAEREKTYTQWFRPRRDRLRRALAERVKLYRAEAYAFIMDPARYPEADHGRAAQPDVDRLVDRLRRAWSRPSEEIAEESSEVQALEQKVLEIGEAALRHLGKEAEARLDAEARLAAARREVDRQLAMEGVPCDPQDQRVLEESLKVMAQNLTVETTLDAEERACVDATNRYRMMFGLVALGVDERLVRAARGHSVDMEKHNFFDHTSPVPGKRTPEDRCRAEGARFSGENIAMGSHSGLGAFDQWYRSSEHHRNILTKGHQTIGIGRQGSYWTQLFGMRTP